MKRWSKLQRELYNIFDPALKLQVHCSVYRMKSQRGSTDIPRYWVTLGKEIIFDYPKQFICNDGLLRDKAGNTIYYPYQSNISDISNIIREYINTPVESIPFKTFTDDLWKITDIFKAADRRIGITTLRNLNLNISGQIVLAERIRRKSHD